MQNERERVVRGMGMKMVNENVYGNMEMEMEIEMAMGMAMGMGMGVGTVIEHALHKYLWVLKDFLVPAHIERRRSA